MIKDYQALAESRQELVEEDFKLIEINRKLVMQITKLKIKRQDNIARRRAISKQIKAHDFELHQ